MNEPDQAQKFSNPKHHKKQNTITITSHLDLDVSHSVAIDDKTIMNNPRYSFNFKTF